MSAVREITSKNVDGLKFYVGIDPEWLPAMVEEGHGRGYKVSMHCAGGGVLGAARARVDEFFHLDGILAVEQESLVDEPWAVQFEHHWERRD